MSKEIVATSQNIENIMSMLTKLENIKDDSSKLREISLDNTGWEGMDASSFNTALSNFTQKLDNTTNDIEEALKEYKSKQEEQLAKGNEAEKTADGLIDDVALANYMKNPNSNIYSNQFRENANKVIAKKQAEELLKPQIHYNILQPSVSPPLAMPSNATPSTATPSIATPSTATEGQQ